MPRSPQKATIVQDVELIFGEVQKRADQPNAIPMMELEDGRVVEANDCDRYVEKGTTGVATFDYDRRVWKFAENQ